MADHDVHVKLKMAKHDMHVKFVYPSSYKQ